MYEFEIEANEYNNILLKYKHGEIGRSYLKSRGISRSTAKFWNLGYCPWGYVPRVYKDIDNEDFYKFWQKQWGRLTIPIIDQNGKTISISGRLILDVKNKPKYDHYSFPSRRILFGLYQNKDNIRELNRCVITEGQMDVITSWQKGLKIITSSFGAHCSLDHFAILSRYTSNIDILYDEDYAGKKGTDDINNFPTWGDLNVNLRKGIFKKGEDLDSWIKHHSKEEFFKLINKSKTDDLKYRLEKLKNVNNS